MQKVKKSRISLDILQRATTKGDEAEVALKEIMDEDKDFELGIDHTDLRRSYNIAIQSLEMQMEDLIKEVGCFEAEVDEHALDREKSLMQSTKQATHPISAESLKTLREFIRFCEGQLKIVRGHVTEMSTASRQLLEHFGEKSLSRTLQTLQKFVHSISSN